MTRRSVLSPWAKLLAIAIAALSVAVAQAQTPQAGTDTDPPVRVGRMSYVSGDVSYSPAGNEEWVEAQLNRPVVTGDRLWADNGARAEMAVDDSAWWLGEQTSVTVSNLDDRIAQLQLQQGTLDFRVRRLPTGNIVEVDTPNLAFTATQPGRYRIQVDPQSGTTSVIVRSGGGEVYGESASYVVGNGEGYRFGGTDLANSEAIGAPPADAFDQFVDERDGRYDRSASVKYVSPEVVGYEDLDTYGAWSAQPSFGNVWFPRTVSAGWAPYRDGHWAWIDPWGWTWVDDAPWGFAPFHYGRWSHFDRGWGWVPGPRAVRAVYAPALVAFIGGAGFSISVSSGPAIGWFPLAPREVYRPPYNVSRNYFRQVNVSNTVINNTTNITNIYNNRGNVTQVNYINRRAPNAVTAVAPAAFAQSQNVGRVAVALPAAALQRGQVQTVARVAPARPAFVGAAPAARVKPPAATTQRAIVAKAPLPPPPLPDARKLPALEKNPGQPLNRRDVQALRAAAPAAAAVAAPAVRVVTPRKPAANEAPPSRRAGAGPSPPAAPPATGRGPEAREPPAARAPEAKGPPAPRAPEAKGPPAPRAPEANGSPAPRAPEAKGPPAPRAPEANGSPAPRAPEAKGPVVARPPEAQRNVIRGPAGRPAEPQGEARVAPPAAAAPPAATPNGPEVRAPESRQRRGPPGAPESTAAPAAPSPEARQQIQRGPVERPAAPQAQPRPEARAAPPRPPEEGARPAPPGRQPEARPAPQAQPQPRPEARAAPPRPPEEAARPAPPARQPEARPAPQAQPKPSPQAKPPEAQSRGEGARPAAAPEPRQQGGKGNENKDGKDGKDGKDDKKDKDKP